MIATLVVILAGAVFIAVVAAHTALHRSPDTITLLPWGFPVMGESRLDRSCRQCELYESWVANRPPDRWEHRWHA